MRYFPMFLDLRGRTVLLAGGGEQMAQKARLALHTEARILVMAVELVPELAAAVASGRIEHVARTYDEASVDAADLIFAASACVGIDAMIAARARAHGAVVNVVDRPKLCTALTPAILDRDPLMVAIGTEGMAPVMARQVRTRLEAMLEPDLGGLVALAGRLRAHVEDHVPLAARRAFWEWVFAGPARRLWREGRAEEAEALIRAEAIRGRGRPAGSVTLLGLPEAADLLSLRAVQRLQAADLVFHPEGAGAALLELARRDAGREPFAGDEARLASRLAGAEGLAAVVLVAPDAAERLAAALAAAGVPAELILPAPDRPAPRRAAGRARRPGQLAGMI
ncbi:MAG TPA: NAD(P)-dependent oxidoreductase [Paracoccaceae bacterium]|nr:NAD(P)-dependent oxidoreductase [Paracoccaceae bacterium]